MASSFRVVVIGGVAAGLKAACKTVRLRPEAEVTVIERGEIVSYAGCGLPYFVSGVVRQREDLYSTPIGVARDVAFFKAVKNVNVLNRTEALSIDRQEKTVRVRRLESRGRLRGKDTPGPQVEPFDAGGLGRPCIELPPFVPAGVEDERLERRRPSLPLQKVAEERCLHLPLVPA